MNPYQQFADGKDGKTSSHVVPTAHSPIVAQPSALGFNPLNPTELYPYRNSFEPFMFRVFTLFLLAMAYCAYFVAVIIVPRAVIDASNGGTDPITIIGASIGISLPVMLCCAVGLYFLKPDFWIKVDRLAMELQITKTRSGGYCAHGPHMRFPLAGVRDVVPKRTESCFSSSGRAFTIEVEMADGATVRLSPSNDLTQARAYAEAQKLMNAVRLCRGEGLVLNV
jgi:hypothetical protein